MHLIARKYGMWLTASPFSMKKEINRTQTVATKSSSNQGLKDGTMYNIMTSCRCNNEL